MNHPVKHQSFLATIRNFFTIDSFKKFQRITHLKIKEKNVTILTIFKVILRTYARRETKNYIFSFGETCGSFSVVHRIILNSVYCVSYLRRNK